MSHRSWCSRGSPGPGKVGWSLGQSVAAAGALVAAGTEEGEREGGEGQRFTVNITMRFGRNLKMLTLAKKKDAI